MVKEFKTKNQQKNPQNTPKMRGLNSTMKNENETPIKTRFVNIPTRVWHRRFIVDPLDDFETILSCDYCDTGNTGDEVLQRNTTFQWLIAKLKWSEFCCITVWKTKWKLNFLITL